jgi:hypothetical protein
MSPTSVFRGCLTADAPRFVSPTASFPTACAKPLRASTTPHHWRPRSQDPRDAPSYLHAVGHQTSQRSSSRKSCRRNQKRRNPAFDRRLVDIHQYRGDSCSLSTSAPTGNPNGLPLPVGDHLGFDPADCDHRVRVNGHKRILLGTKLFTDTLNLRYCAATRSGSSTSSGVPCRSMSAAQRWSCACARRPSRSCDRRDGFTVALLGLRPTDQQPVETLVAEDGEYVESHV